MGAGEVGERVDCLGVGGGGGGGGGKVKVGEEGGDRVD